MGKHLRSISRTAIITIVVVVILVAAVAAVLIMSKPPAKTTTTPTTTTPTTTTPTTATTITPPTTTTKPPTPTATTTTPTTTPPTCKEKITLVILTRHPTEILEKTRDLFLKSEIAKKYCVVDLKFVQLPPGWWVQYIRNNPVDVAWGGGPTLFDTLFREGLLKPLETKIALDAVEQIPDVVAGSPMKRVKDGKVYWVAAAIASFGFTINKEVATNLGFDWKKLRTWKDLASDELGLLMYQVGTPVLGIADPTVSTSNTRMYEIILQAYGWEQGWRVLTLMAANARIYGGSSLVRDAVMNGEIMVGITIDFYGYTAHRYNPACIYIAPSGETIVNGDPIAVTVSTKHPEAAEAFVAWVLTEGQKVWLDPSINRLPANPKVFETPEGKQRRDLYEAYQQALKAKAMEFNDTLALMYEEAMRLYFKATLVDLHDLLQEAWLKLLKAYYIDKRISKDMFEALKLKLASLPEFIDPVTGKKTKFTVQYAITVNKLILEKPQLASKLMSVWRDAARAKYLEVLKALGG